MSKKLNYIYWTMYALDVSKSIYAFCEFLTFCIPIVWGLTWSVTIFIALSTGSVDYCKILWGYTYIAQIISYIILGIVLMLDVFMPSQNTIKTYIGVKAAQVVDRYLNDNTDIPEHCKKTINTLWNKVDSYIETIGESNNVNER